MKSLFSLFIFIGFSFILHAQSYFEFLPDGLNFLPLRANPQEAKLGVLYYPDNADLKVDIGNSMDLFSIYFPSSKSKLNFGIEFFAYASVIGYQQLRLQIDAVDGYFGGNATYSKFFSDNELSFRFRFIHNSAHLVDGNWWISNYPRNWTKEGGPIPFTKDFAELTSAHILRTENFNLRYYGLISYSLRVRPSELKRFSAALGFELNSNKIISHLFNKPVNLFIANHINFAGYPEYTGTNQCQAGIKFGEWNEKGILFYLSYFAGNNFFSEYYAQRIRKFGIGFMVDFP